MDYIRDLNLKNKQLKENEIKIYFYYYYYFNRYASNTVKKKKNTWINIQIQKKKC